ncbi:YLP motif-containing protein 1-like isoform X2 [Culex pipiens pallens]|uniref:YLP motif-containing protein 1-like isoform X2 n=1 Tax=Culex pipiens pallens TaxID=42434 RepID=UPI001954AB8B|nr:YLP motif-containing protein 1-like isoform X2 [Culex pipiens pallens]
MSWPGNSWPAQPAAYGGYSTAVPPPNVGPMAPAMQPGPGAYAPDQYAQWQQWQQYQQQYAQWHAQYGEQYARQMGTPMAAVPTPAAIPIPTVGPAPYAAPPPTTLAAPPPPAEPHPDTLAARKSSQAPPPPPPQEDEQSQKTTEELAFDEQFRKWEEEFENWKSKNANHPDKSAYREYEKKFIECRKKLLERRVQLRNKRLAELASKASAPPPLPPAAESVGQGMGLFANALGGGGGGGIPGLDLLNENRRDDGNRLVASGEVAEIIELDDDNDIDIKPDISKVNANAAAANPVTALASLLKDPKVSALLNIITNNAQGTLPNLPAGQSDILQKLHSAAGAVVNANGGLPAAVAPAPQPQVPFMDERSRTSLHSGGDLDDRSQYASYQQQQQQQPPLPQTLNFAGIPGVSAPPPNLANNGYNTYGGFPGTALPPPSYATGPPPAGPVPLMGIDISRPPPMSGSPAPSNASSSHSQNRQSRWGQDKPPNRNQKQQQQKQKQPFNGGDFPKGPPPQQQQQQQKQQQQQQQRSSRWGMKEKPQKPGPPPKPQQFNGAKPAPLAKELLDERNLPNYYSGHLDELQVDPELGTPCAVPKPEWMTEEEYDEIFDRYEHVEAFEERKYKMELAIRLLEQQKKKEQQNNGKDVGQRLPPAKRPNPFASDDDFFRPKQVIDYSNGAPQIIDYGHSSTPSNNQGNNGRSERPGPPGQPNRFDYNHSQQQQGFENRPFNVDRPPHYTETSTSKLAQMHANPNPDESNPSYPCKFILMNDNRPNRPSTKRGKRASSIRKQKLREQQQQGQQGPIQPEKEQQQQQHQLSKLDAPPPFMNDLPVMNAPPPFMDDLPPPVAAAPAAPFVHPAAFQDEPLSDYELEMKRGEPVEDGSLVVPCAIVPIEDLLMKPARFQRPSKICFVMRGLPGSGKSYLARAIKDCEVKQGGQAPRVLSLDDYFLVETEEREPDPKTGRPVLVTKSEYKFDGDMEDIYMQNLVKAFKRTITEDVFHFIIVDCPNEHLKYYNEFYAIARSSGFKVFTVTLQTEIDLCIEQNVHNRTADEIRSYANNWTLGPDDHPLINASVLFDEEGHGVAGAGAGAVVVSADMDLCSDEDEGFQKDGEAAKDGNGGEESVAAGDGAAVAEQVDDADEDSNLDGQELGWTASASPRDVPRP